MYCPNCGSNNQAEIKFCTRCGTNLGVVSEALTGKQATPPQSDERMVKLLKDYYASRRATLIGGLTLPAGLALLMAMFVTGFPEHLLVIALLGLGLTIYGAIIGIWGVGHWVDSTSEMKALNVVVPANNARDASRASIETSRIASLPARVDDYSTDPIEPGSVTEQTTRQLDSSNANRDSEA
ncbi:MAG TPA: zinc ribbon domain-containing protein [Blastocatellia bacterium]|nr:zinc ribbon domain-containing protein [Blastocatellia bacterium]